jgi:hypothetical protein
MSSQFSGRRRSDRQVLMMTRVTDTPDESRKWLWLRRFDQVMERLVPSIAIIIGVLALIATFFIYRGLEEKADIAEVKATRAEIKAEAAAIRLRSAEQGRRIARQTLCAGIVGVQRAGRAALQGTLLPTRLRMFTTAQERRLRRIQARRYSRIISGAVADAAPPRGLLKANGTLDCAELSRVATRPNGP